MEAIVMNRWVTKELVDYTVSANYENYPEEVIEKAKLFILDNIGCALGGQSISDRQSRSRSIHEHGRV